MKLDDYRKFIQKIELVDQVIPKFNWERKYVNIDPSKTIIQIKVEGTKPKITKNNFTIGNLLEINGKSNENDKILFTIQAEITLKFSKTAETKREMISVYIEKTLPLSTIPIFRYLVRDALEKMGLPPFTLPLWKDVTQEDNNEDEVQKI